MFQLNVRVFNNFLLFLTMTDYFRVKKHSFSTYKGVMDRIP